MKDGNMENLNQYIKDWFINLSLKKIPPSFFVIRQSLLKAIDELKPKISGNVLDLGCGVMPYKEYLKTSSIDSYLGVDIKQTLYHDLLEPDLSWDGINIPLKDSSCDYVLATEFFEHYYDIDHILREIKRVLKKDGILFFTVPSIWPIHEAPFDYHRFTPFSLDLYFKKAEFSSWEVKPLGGFYTCLSLILSFWFERKSPIAKWCLKPFLYAVIRFFIKKDKLIFPFVNGQFHSGLYGFVVK